jgi:hypothetical protein
VLAAFAPLFTQPSWLRAQALLCGTLLAPANHTVTAALRALGLAGEPGSKNYHRLLNRARWSARHADDEKRAHPTAARKRRARSLPGACPRGNRLAWRPRMRRVGLTGGLLRAVLAGPRERQREAGVAGKFAGAATRAGSRRGARREVDKSQGMMREVQPCAQFTRARGYGLALTPRNLPLSSRTADVLACVAGGRGP